MEDIGIEFADRQRIADELAHLFADIYAVYLKTQGFHWNVKGCSFYTLHVQLEKQYDVLVEYVDRFAERLVQLGFAAPATFSSLANLTQIEEIQDFSDTREMVRRLIRDHATLIRSARALSGKASDVRDNGTCALLDGFIEGEEKILWMMEKFAAQ